MYVPVCRYAHQGTQIGAHGVQERASPEPLELVLQWLLWELSAGPLQELYMLSITEQSISPYYINFNNVNKIAFFPLGEMLQWNLFH